MFKKKDQPSEAILKAAKANGVHLYYVRYMGNMEVEERKGQHVVDATIATLKNAKSVHEHTTRVSFTLRLYEYR